MYPFLVPFIHLNHHKQRTPIIMNSESEIPELRLDSANLYREVNFTDRRVGVIRKLIPVYADGSDDPNREIIFEGSTSLMTPAGNLPINFPIEAQTLSEALEAFPLQAKKSIENTIEELRELRRESASSIVVPGQSSDIGSLGGSGTSGGGGIKLR